jgi:hypothetical protein
MIAAPALTVETADRTDGGYRADPDLVGFFTGAVGTVP